MQLLLFQYEGNTYFPHINTKAFPPNYLKGLFLLSLAPLKQMVGFGRKLTFPTAVNETAKKS
jgi:hypothetical protein